MAAARKEARRNPFRSPVASAAARGGVARAMPQVDGMSESPHSQTRLVVQHEEGFQFRIRFEGRMSDIVTDEPPPLGSGDGPSPSALLGAAIGNCLAASLMFCMERSRLELRDLEAEVTVVPGRNPEGRLRIQRVDVRLLPLVTAEVRDQLARCSSLYESFCTVAESVRQGIPVHVDLQPRVVGTTETPQAL
jgi:uncharacterized OsmC-like protein